MWQIGDSVVPGYKLEKFLGRGQFGEVWRATSPGGTVCAVKLLNLGGKQGWKEFRSIQRIKRVRHPHLAPFNAIWLLDEAGHVLSDDAMASLGLGDQKSRSTLVPDREPDATRPPTTLVVATVLGDKTLGDRMRECQQQGHRGIPVQELLGYMDEAAKGIDFLNRGAHDLGDSSGPMQHCDIKPENILLIGNSALICDFGVSQVLGSDDASTATATSMLGSPAYMSPECILRKPSAASDQYSLALTYYELRTGQLPFDELQIMQVLDAHRHGKLNLSQLPKAEQRVIRKATAVQPSQRYASATDMMRALREAVEAQPRRRSGRQGWPLAAIAALVLVSAAIWIGTRSGGISRIEPLPDDATVVDDHGRPKPQNDAPVPPRESAEVYARRALAAVETEDLDAKRLSAAVEDYRRAIELDPSGPYTITPPPFILLPPADGASQDSPTPLQCMAVAEDQQRVVAGGDDGRVWMWRLDARTEAPILLAEHSRRVWHVSIQGPVVASLDMGGAISIVFLDRARQQIQSRASGKNPGGMAEAALSRDGQWLATGDQDGAVRFWRLAAGQASLSPLEAGNHAEPISAVVFSADGRWAVTAGVDNRVRQWPVPPQAGEASILGELTGDVLCLVPLGSTGRIAFAGEGRPLQAFSAKRPEEHQVGVAGLDEGTSWETLPLGHVDTIEALASDSAGRWLASGSADGSIQVWPLTEGASPTTPVFLHGHSRTIRSMAFCHISGWLVSASDDSDPSQRVALWQLSGNKTPMWLTGHQGRITAVATTRRWIITACDDGAIRLWSLGACLLVAEACDQEGLTPRPATDKPLIKARRFPSAGPPHSVLAAGS